MFALARRWLGGLAVLGAFIACGGRSIPEPGAPLTPPTALCVQHEPPLQACRRAGEIESWLSSDELEIISSGDTPTGKQGARVLTLAVPTPAGRVVFRAKWRNQATVSSLNDPRREVAAFAFARLFLRPDQFVVPPAAGHCFDLADYRRRVDGRASSPFANASCVFGFLSYWIEGGKGRHDAEDEGWIPSDELLDEALFRKDPGYRRSVADVNLLAHLISHGDSHPKQFLFTNHFDQLRIYLVDNSIAFSSFRNPRIKPDDDWVNVLVPAVSSESIERLRALNQDAISALIAVERYRVRDGRLRRQSDEAEAPEVRTPSSEDAEQGLRWVGDEFQVGLTRKEAAVVWARLQALLQRVDRGSLRTFALGSPEPRAIASLER